MDLKPTPVLGRRSSSKLKTLKIDDRMVLQLPRLGLATQEQLEYLDRLYPEGGQRAIQALLNLMQSGVVDSVIWKRESWVGDSVGSVTGIDDDKLDLLDPVAMPPTGGCNLMVTEGVLESMWNQLLGSVNKSLNDHAASAQPIEVMATEVPRQVCMMVQRIRFTNEIQRCIREARQLATVTRANIAIKNKITERILDKETPSGHTHTLKALQQVLHEQFQVLSMLCATEKDPDKLGQVWKEQMRFYHDDKERHIEVRFFEKQIILGNEYSPPRMLITTNFTHNLRWAYLDAMSEGGDKLLVLVGPPGCGKTGMLVNIGQLLGTLPTVIRITEQTPQDAAWWQRRLIAAQATGGGAFAPVIVTQAHAGSEAQLGVCVDIAKKLGLALCVTMAPGAAADRFCSTVLAGSPTINIPESELLVISAGQLAAEGLKDADTLAVPLAATLETLRSSCSQQPHYDFGPRTLMQLCTQIAKEKLARPAIPEKDVIATVVERCLSPKLVKADVAVLKGLLKDQFGVDMKLVSSDDARWYRVAENIKSITKVEPDCIVLPVDNEELFYEEFCKMLNRHGSAMVKFPGKLSDYSPEQLLGTMPRKRGDGQFEERKDGELVVLLRKAMEDYIDPNMAVWICMQTGSISPEIWECLHELLNDSGCINLPTGEQMRLTENLRFLFVMQEAGNTPQDTFSRAAVVYTDPPK